MEIATNKLLSNLATSNLYLNTDIVKVISLDHVTISLCLSIDNNTASRFLEDLYFQQTWSKYLHCEKAI